MQPLVTIAFLSWNRLHYLKATLESARRCVLYPDIEWIVSDNESDEPGLKDYLESCTWLTRRIYKRQSHADAMNQIVAEAKGKYLLLWPDDIQFIVSGPWLADLVEIMEKHPQIGHFSIDALKKRTLKSLFGPRYDVLQRLKELYWYRTKFRRSFDGVSRNGFRIHTLGWRASGIGGPGINSLTRTGLWRTLGPWKTGGSSTGLIDSSLGAEEYMFNRFHLSRLPLQAAICYVPVAADIVTDPTGCKAKVRGQYRYGVYMPAPSPDGLYYRIHDLKDLDGGARTVPLSFSEMVEPIGFRIPVDGHGDRLKSALNMSVMYDMKNGREVKYPLALPPG